MYFLLFKNFETVTDKHFTPCDPLDDSTVIPRFAGKEINIPDG